MREVPGDGPISVLMLAWEYPPRIVGGLAIHVAGLSRALARRGIRVTVLTVGGPRIQTVHVEDGVEVVRTERDHFRGQTMLDGTRAMNEAFLGLADVHARDVALVHAHDWMTTPAALAVARARALPLVATFHSTEYGRASHLFRAPQPDLEIQEMEHELYRTADECLTPSQSMVEELGAVFGERTVRVIPNGIDLPSMVRRRRPEPGRILFAGRLVQEKGAWHLLHALARILPHDAPAHLILAGVGPERQALRREAARLGIAEAVEFLGQLTPEDLASERERAEVAVVPSLYEPFGLVALEAMTWGVPLVASDVGGLREFTDGAALLVPPGSAAALADAISRLLGDGDLRHELSVLGRRRAAAYTWDACAERTARVYQMALAGREPRQDRPFVR